MAIEGRKSIKDGKRFVDSVELPFFSELFAAWVRYSGAALGPSARRGHHRLHPTYRGGTVRGSAVGGWPLVAAYVTLACLVSALCIFLATETFRKDIVEVEPVEREVIAEPRVQ